MGKILVVLALVIGGASYWALKDPYADPQWVTSEALRISRQNAADAPDADDISFLQTACSRKLLDSPSLTWTLLERIRSHDEGTLFQLTAAFLDLGAQSEVHADKAPDLARLGGQLLEKKSYLLGARCFEKAIELMGDRLQATDLSTWHFFAGLGYDQARQPGRAIEHYKVAHQLNPDDYRPSRQLGLLYWKMAQEKPEERAALTLAKKYLFASLKAKRDQADLEKVLADLERLSLERLQNMNPNMASNLPQVPRPGPDVSRLTGQELPGNPAPRSPEPVTPTPDMTGPSKRIKLR